MKIIVEMGLRWPHLPREVSADSHPFWTGAHRVLDTAGRVEKFERKYGRRTPGRRGGEQKGAVS